MTSPRIGVLALQGDVREHVRALEQAGAEPRPFRRPAELAGLDGVVLPGGESTTIGKLLEITGLLEPLRGALAEGLPAYGSCAGMILLARSVLDGRPDQPTLDALDVVVRRNAFGRQVDSFEADLHVTGVAGPPVRAVFIRAPWVESVGAGVEVLATAATEGEAGPAKVVAVRQGRVLATSFHPELTGDSRMHELFVTMVTARPVKEERS